MSFTEHNISHADIGGDTQIISFLRPEGNLHVQVSTTPDMQGSDFGQELCEITQPPSQELDTKTTREGAFRVLFDEREGLLIDFDSSKKTKDVDIPKPNRPDYQQEDLFLAERFFPNISERALLLANGTGRVAAALAMVDVWEMLLDSTPSDIFKIGGGWPVYTTAAIYAGWTSSRASRKRIQERIPLSETSDTHKIPGRRLEASDKMRGQQMEHALFIQNGTVAFDSDSGSLPEFFGIDSDTIPTFELLDYLYGSRDLPVNIQGNFVNERIRRKQYDWRNSREQSPPDEEYTPPVPGTHYTVLSIKANPAAVLSKVINDPAAFEGTDDVVVRLFEPLLEIQGLQAQRRGVEDEIATIHGIGIDQRSPAGTLQHDELSTLEIEKRMLETQLLYITLDVAAAYLVQREEALAARVAEEIGNANSLLKDNLTAAGLSIKAAINEKSEHARKSLASYPITEICGHDIENDLEEIKRLASVAQDLRAGYFL